jgi:hypothetical protein
MSILWFIFWFNWLILSILILVETFKDEVEGAKTWFKFLGYFLFCLVCWPAIWLFRIAYKERK